MEHTKKMVIVPMTEYEGFKNLMSKTVPSAHYNQDIRTTAMRTLEDQIQSILKDETTDESLRVLLYQQAMQKYLQLRGRTEEMFEIAATPRANTTGNSSGSMLPVMSYTPQHESLSLSAIVEKTPTNQKRNVLKLLEDIKQNGTVGWNDKGEVTVDGQYYKNSDIGRFAQAVFSNLPNVILSTSRLPGWTHFRKAVGTVRTFRSETPQRASATSEPLNIHWDVSDF